MGVLTKRLMEVIEGKVSKEQGGFRKGKACVDLHFLLALLHSLLLLLLSPADSTEVSQT